ncbi:hypothetical protein Pint_04217 [Pistacia integerrima]|uniref:Uncharacterized protein n=1 Tax=Pistacia integerrima TaxID=434235 RepID=A0ACC0Z5G1_9ROSI|nr:hypothetical protein Pint_04217 [Pistacia integerrima]
MLLAGSGPSLKEAAQHAASCHPSISQVLVADSDKFSYPIAEPWAKLVHMVQQRDGYSHIISASGSFGKNILPRAAALLDVSPITDVIEISGSSQFVRPIYAGNALCTVRYTGANPCMLTIRSTSFPVPPSSAASKSNEVPITQVDLSTLDEDMICDDWIVTQNPGVSRSQEPPLFYQCKMIDPAVRPSLLIYSSPFHNYPYSHNSYSQNRLSSMTPVPCGPYSLNNLPNVYYAPYGYSIGKSRYVKHTSQDAERPDLGSARIVVTGGRGLKSAENFRMIEKLAEKLGAAVGATRAAVDAGFVPNDLQVGQTGKIVAPELYIAFGVSGAIQHLAGMRDSKVIVAVNKDADAPIFQVADYGLVGDLFEVIPELLEKIPEKK